MSTLKDAGLLDSSKTNLAAESIAHPSAAL